MTPMDRTGDAAGGQEERENRFWTEDRVLFFRIVSRVDEDEAKRLDVGGRALLDSGLADRVMIEILTSADFPTEVRKRWADFLQHPAIERTAIFGLSLVVSVVATMVIAMSGRGENVRVFKTEKEARQWLLEGHQGGASRGAV